MQDLLTPQLVSNLRDCNRIVVITGDITSKDFGIDKEILSNLQQRISIFIHAASSISLSDGLPKMASCVVQPSLVAAKMALSFSRLERFVYVSTAYVNGFLHWQPLDDKERHACTVEERIYSLRSTTTSSNTELDNILEFGTTPEYSCIRHPYAYSYVKHLTERLLLDAFLSASREQQLLILRPSCFAPAQQEPYPHFEVPGSTPVTTAMCAIIASKPTKARCSSNLADPSKSTIDEVPVDIVVNRLVAHIVFGTYGCVHAVSGASGCRSFPDMYNAIARLRRPWWWHPTLSWCNDDADPSSLCRLSRFYKILGCSYEFRQEKTEKVWELMGPSTRERWPL